MSDQDIREWAREHGLNIKDSGPIPASIRTRYDDYVAGPEEEGSTQKDQAIKERAPQEVPSDTPQAVSGFGQIRERARRRFWDRGRTDRMLTSRPKKTPQPRVSIDRLVQRIWGVLSDITKPVNMPVSRVLALQSPVAGLLLEETLRNTAMDRVLQPLARGGHKLEIGHALIGPPLFTLLLTARPEMAPILVPALKDALRTWLDVAGPQIEKAAKREAEYIEKYGGRIDDLINYILGDMIETPPNGEVVRERADSQL